MKLLRAKQTKLIILLLMWLPVQVCADGIHLGAGFYNLSATVGAKKTTLSSPSAYSLSYTKTFYPKLSFELGYSFLFENVFGGDMSYGPQLGLRYYYYGTTTNKTVSVDTISIQSIRSYNPYASVGFSQKEFQSIKSSYSGFYVGGGVEFGWKSKISLYTDFKYSSLSGPVKGTANEVTATIGIIYHDF